MICLSCESKGSKIVLERHARFVACPSCLEKTFPEDFIQTGNETWERPPRGILNCLIRRDSLKKVKVSKSKESPAPNFNEWVTGFQIFLTGESFYLVSEHY